MFKVGDKVCHLSHGIGEVSSIEERSFMPNKNTIFYIITINDNDVPKKVFVPINASEQRLRKIITINKANQILNYIKKFNDPIDNQTWNRRYRSYMELIHSGDSKNIAKVYCSLISIKDNMSLSFGERKLLDQAKTLLVKELSCALNKSENEIEEQLEVINELCNKTIRSI